jgi:hypothetical protein
MPAGMVSAPKAIRPVPAESTTKNCVAAKQSTIMM